MPILDPLKRREYHRAWIAERRRAFFCQQACAECGAKEHLQLDYIGEGRPNGQHRMWSCTESRRVEALKKYRCICADCYRNQVGLSREKQEVLMAAIRDGKGSYWIQDELGYARDTILRYRRRALKGAEVPTCKCGKPLGHCGICAWRHTNNPTFRQRAATNLARWVRSNGASFLFQFPTWHVLRDPGPRCTERSCPYPRLHDLDVCRQHLNFYEFEISMISRELDMRDLFPGKDESKWSTTLRIATRWEMEHYETTIR